MLIARCAASCSPCGCCRGRLGSTCSAEGRCWPQCIWHCGTLAWRRGWACLPGSSPAASGSLAPVTLHHHCCPCRFSIVPSQHSATVTLYRHMCLLSEHTRVVSGLGMSAGLLISCLRATCSCNPPPPLLPLLFVESAQSAFCCCDSV